MRRESFTLLHKAENSWWYYGRSLAVRALLRRSGVREKAASILDFGAGNGGMYPVLARLGTRVYAFEPDKEARSIASKHGYEKVYESADEALTQRYDLIGLFDVVEHIEDDVAFLRSLHKALVPGGVLAITVPAFMFLWSTHDVAHHHFRRYTRRSLLKLLRETGYEVSATSYWNMVLLFPAAAVRLTNRSGAETLTPPPFINTILKFIVGAEAILLRLISFPFGISLVSIARKQGQDDMAPSRMSEPVSSQVVSIIIPVYNEGRIIAHTLETISAFLHASRFPYRYRILVVDNASTDHTRASVEKIMTRHQEISLLSLSEKGKGRAIRAGWNHVDGDILAFMDADLSSDLGFFRSLIDAVASGSADLSIGNRLGARSKVVSNKEYRKIASYIYNLIARVLLRTEVDDHQCGFKAISRTAFLTLEPHLTDTQFFFDTELIALARAKGFSIRELDIAWTDAAPSKVRLFKDSLSMFGSVLRLWWRLRVNV